MIILGILGRGRRTCRVLRTLMARRPLPCNTVPGSPLVAKNSPQDCFLNAQTLSGSSPYRKREPHFCDSFLLAGAEGLAACFALLWLADRCRATVPGSPLLAKNSPQDCFLNAQTLSGSSPYRKKEPHSCDSFLLAERVQLNPNLNPTFQGRQK